MCPGRRILGAFGPRLKCSHTSRTRQFTRPELLQVDGGLDGRTDWRARQIRHFSTRRRGRILTRTNKSWRAGWMAPRKEREDALNDFVSPLPSMHRFIKDSVMICRMLAYSPDCWRKCSWTSCCSLIRRLHGSTRCATYVIPGAIVPIISLFSLFISRLLSLVGVIQVSAGLIVQKLE